MILPAVKLRRATRAWLVSDLLGPSLQAFVCWASAATCPVTHLGLGLFVLCVSPQDLSAHEKNDQVG